MISLTFDYFDGYVHRRSLQSPVTAREATEIGVDEVRMLRRWADRGLVEFVRSYARSIHQRVWDEGVNVIAIERECRALLHRLECAA